MIDIRYPSITGTNDAAQLMQVKSYLHQLVDQLNMALKDMEQSTAPAVAVAKSVSAGKAAEDKEAQSTFNSIKALIIKSADIVNAYYDEINYRLESVYVAESEFGTYAEQTTKMVQETALAINEMYSKVQTLVTDVYGEDGKGGIKGEILETDAYIKRGELDTDENGYPVIGIEIGQTNKKYDKEIFSKYARFTSDKLSFYDQGGNEVAYVSDNKLYIKNIEVIRGEDEESTFSHGGFKDTALADGSIVTKWIGGA